MTLDSDSDYEIQEDVELGLPDRSVQEYDRQDPFICRLGGEPAWLISRVSSELCPLCSSKMYFFLQFECPTDQDENFDRVLYVFACNTKKCLLNSPESCFRVILQSLSSSGKQEKRDTKMSANFWETGSENVFPVSQNAKAAQMVRCGINGTDTFPVVVLKVIDELIRPKPRIEPPQLNNDEDQDNVSSDGDVAADDEVMDSFFERVADYPKQCVRYCPNGRPLHFSQKYADKSFEPNCPHCNSTMVFLAQLMPAILSFLPVDKYINHIPEIERGKFAPFDDGLEFATVLIYSCPTCKGPTISTSVCVELEEFN